MSIDQLDHLVYAAPDLQRGIDAVATLTGVVATPGGQHPGRGTRNALVALGPRRYLEIIAPDPDQPSPSQPRWLGVDGVREPRLTTWAAHGVDLAALVRLAALADITLGPVRDGSRMRADGVALRWQLTEPDPLVLHGVVPFFIDWGTSPHPSAAAAEGVSLVEFRLQHPDAEHVRRVCATLGVRCVVERHDAPAIVALLSTPRGLVELR